MSPYQDHHIQHDCNSNRLFPCSHYCEKGSALREVCVGWADYSQEDACVFSNFFDRFDAETRQTIDDEVGPAIDKTSSQEEKEEKTAKYEKFLAKSCDPAANMHKFCATSPCNVHQKPCSVRHRARLRHPTLHQPRMRSVSGGVTCTGWTGAGAQMRFCDTSQTMHHLFMGVAAKEHRENAFCIECSDKYQSVQQAVEPCKVTHTVIHVKSNPPKRGRPVSRPREFLYGVANHSHVWV